MRYILLSLIFCLSGCATAQMPGYIGRIDHPYQQKVYGSFEKVVSSIDFVLKKHGWSIINEVDPFVYERDDRYEGNGYQNLLIMTNVRKEALHLTGMHLNILVHSLEGVCDIEVRYESKTSVITSGHNDPIVQAILNDLQDEVSR